MHKNITLYILAIMTMVTGCDLFTSGEVARLHITKISTNENLDWQSAAITLEADEKIYFWTDIDMEYEGDLGLQYQVQLLKEGKTQGYMRLDPMKKDVTKGEHQQKIGNKTTWKYNGRIGFFKIKEPGEYIFKAILVSNANETLQLNKADLVIKK